MKKEINKIRSFSRIVGYIIVIFGIINLGFFVIELYAASNIGLMNLWFLTSGTLLILTGIFIYFLSITLGEPMPRRKR